MEPLAGPLRGDGLVRDGRAADPGPISADHARELVELDRGGYWWFAVRRAHLEAELAAAVQPGRFDYLDFGCGAGGALEFVRDRFGPRHALGIDGTPEALDRAREAGLPVQRSDLHAPLALAFEPDAITCLDVLEHLDDPVLALRRVAAAAAPGALLLVTVPALPSLWSRWDEVSGHRRRYTRALLRRQLAAGGWRVVRTRSLFSYAVPPAWVARKLGRVQRFEFPRVSPLLNALLTAAGRLERRLGCPVPLGTSLLATARLDPQQGRELRNVAGA